MKEANLTTVARRAKILEMLEAEGEIYVHNLSEQFNISEVTIRNDLSVLEKKGLLIKTRGGAIKRPAMNYDLTLSQKLKTNFQQKQKIGKKAVEYIKDGYTIVFDSGSTTLAVAKNLKRFKNLHVITNSLPIADELADYKGVEVILPGGILRKEMRSIIGPMAEQTLRNYYCDVAFIGVDGIDKQGFYTPNIYEASLSKIMAKIAKKVIVVCDSSKFGRRSFVKIDDIKAIDIIITDQGISQEYSIFFEEAGVELITV